MAGEQPGILDPVMDLGPKADALVVARANAMYAKDYSAAFDIALVVRGFRALGRA